MGAAVGTVLSLACAQTAWELVQEAASDTGSDYWYSNGNLSMEQIQVFSQQISAAVFMAVGAAVFLLSLLSCVLFTTVVMHKKSGRSVRIGRREGRFHILVGGAAKMAGLSVLRGQWRTWIPVLVSGVCVFLLLQLPFTAKGYEERLEDLNQNTQLRGYFTDINGQGIDGLTVDATLIRDLAQSGHFSELYVAKEYHYSYIGKKVNGEVEEVEGALQMTNSSFGQETLEGTLKNLPSIVCTNHLESCPEFFYTSGTETEFLDGYDETFLAEESAQQLSCMVSTDFLESQGLVLGDEIRIMVLVEFSGGSKTQFVDLVIVGSFEKAGQDENIYAPLSVCCSPALLFGKEEGSLDYLTMNSVSFPIGGGRQLMEIKQYLRAQGYSQVNQVRTIRSFILLEDQNFLATRESMEQKISLMDQVFPVLYGLTLALAVICSYILVKMKRTEITVMRLQGTPRRICFLTVLLEQLALLLAGAAAGTAVWSLGNSVMTAEWLLFPTAFVLCWIAGTVVSALVMMRGNIRAAEPGEK